MILSDGEIMELSIVETNPLIAPFNEKQLTPNGYDLAIDKISIVKDVYLVPKDDGGKKMVVIPGHKTFIVLTKEKVTMPSKLKGRLEIRTTYARMGVIPAFGGVDAGFSGLLNLCCYNGNESPIEMELGSTFTQMSFEQIGREPLKLYAVRSGNYMNQDKIIK